MSCPPDWQVLIPGVNYVNCDWPLWILLYGICVMAEYMINGNHLFQLMYNTDLCVVGMLGISAWFLGTKKSLEFLGMLMGQLNASIPVLRDWCVLHRSWLLRMQGGIQLHPWSIPASACTIKQAKCGLTGGNCCMELASVSLQWQLLHGSWQKKCVTLESQVFFFWFYIVRNLGSDIL